MAVNEAAMVDPSDLSISVMILTFDVDQHGTKPSNLAHNSSPPWLAPLHKRMIFVRNRILHGRECAKTAGAEKGATSVTHHHHQQQHRQIGAACGWEFRDGTGEF